MIKMERLQVLTLVACYLPGYKGGGPIRTIANTVDQLGDDVHFKVITTDRDLGDSSPYSGVVPGAWTQVGKGEVMYLAQKGMSLGVLRNALNKTAHDVLYLNSFFSFDFAVKPLLFRRLGLIPQAPVIVAPRGEFSPGAMAFKSLKKLLYVRLARLLGLYADVVWQASTDYEAEDIRRSMGGQCSIVVAPNFRAVVTDQPPRKTKVTARLTIIFLSRISQKKNLDGALRMLKRLKGEIRFDIYGPIEDTGYWSACQRLIAELPANVTVRYLGSIEHENVGTVMAEHDLFLLPTHGENFGHVILEALMAGTPILISDQTPWRDLALKDVGWDLPLDAEHHFEQVLQELVSMDAETHGIWCDGARRHGTQCSRDDRIVEQNRNLFRVAVKEPVEKGGAK